MKTLGKPCRPPSASPLTDVGALKYDRAMAKQLAGKSHRHIWGKSVVQLARPLWLVLVVCALGLVWTSPASAENLIKQPGQHNKYSWELEPHLYVRYGGFWGHSHGGAGVGPGIRASIPFMHNGPIKTINNNIGITFGVDVPFFFNNSVAFDVPVAFQWNFYFTKIISVIGEAGLLSSIWTGQGHTHFHAFPIVQGAGRFQFGKVGIVARIGYPSTTVGANFQF